jgi:hypothetical protein
LSTASERNIRGKECLDKKRNSDMKVKRYVSEGAHGKEPSRQGKWVMPETIRYCQKFYEKQGMRYGNKGMMEGREERQQEMEQGDGK